MHVSSKKKKKCIFSAYDSAWQTYVTYTFQDHFDLHEMQCLQKVPIPKCTIQSYRWTNGESWTCWYLTYRCTYIDSFSVNMRHVQYRVCIVLVSITLNSISMIIFNTPNFLTLWIIPHRANRSTGTFTASNQCTTSCFLLIIWAMKKRCPDISQSSWVAL